MNMEMNFSGDSAAIARIKAKGIKLPMMITKETRMAVNIKTGVLGSVNDFPIVLSLKDEISKKTVNDNDSNEAPDPLIGQSIYGQCTADGKMRIDSISGKIIDDQTKNAISTSISKLLNQMQFPTNPMKIGDTFNQKEPFNLPIAGSNINMTIDIVYKLVSVEGNVAYFDLDESMDFDMSIEKNGTSMLIKGNGKGNGKLVYDIKGNYSIDRNSDLKVNYAMQLGKLQVAAEGEISTTIKTQMSALVN